MPMTVSGQAHVFLFAVIGGMLIAFIYDLFRIMRRAVKSCAIFIYLEDFIYWIIVAVVMLGMLYYSNEGEMRGYIFIGTAMGALLYVLLLSWLIVGVSMFVLKIIQKFFSAVWMVLTYPFKIIFRVLAIPGRFLLKIIRRAAKSARQSGRARLAKAVLWKKILRNKIKKI